MSMRLWPGRIRARSQEVAYDLIARHHSDPALMAGRDHQTNQTKLERVAAALPISPTTALLDIGPGDGTLMRLLAPKVNRCYGLDPSSTAVERLDSMLGDVSNARFSVGSILELPFADSSFDVVVVNSVLHMLPSTTDAEVGVKESIRVCRSGGHLWFGEVPFRSEQEGGLVRKLTRRTHEYGLRNFGRLLFSVYVRPLLYGEPMLVYPAPSHYVPEPDFRRWCQELGVTVESYRHREPARDSSTRMDYLVSK